MTIKIVTYNVLARLLCNEEAYRTPNYDPAHLDFEFRYNSLLEKLRGCIDDDPLLSTQTVFCLQEVDVELSCRLQLVFKYWGYDFIYHPYGQWYNGYMGVAIAVPKDLNIVKVDKFRLADGKWWPTPFKDEFWGAGVVKWLSGGWIDYTAPKYVDWEKSKRKYNFMLTVEIEDEDIGRSLFISNVHMPCSFRSPSTMLTYTALAMEHLQTLAGGNPYVLTGDFNATIESEYYKMMETGTCDESVFDHDFPPEDKWRPSKLEMSLEYLKPLRNAHKIHRGEYLPYTTRCINSIFGATTPFQGTLDHIMVSDGIMVSDSFSGDLEDGILCPNADEPSDHLTIWADIEW